MDATPPPDESDVLAPIVGLVIGCAVVVGFWIVLLRLLGIL